MFATPANVRPGTMLRGFGLHNAGRYATVLAVGPKFCKIEEHLSARVYRSTLRYWRIA